MVDALRDQLRCLAGYVRDPQRHAPPPGIDARRLAIYRRLFFGNIESLLAGSFPVIRACLGNELWQALVHTFYADYRCQTPLFTEIAGEFVDYLENSVNEQEGERINTFNLPRWLAELAHYERVEGALLLSDMREPNHDPHGNLLDGIPVLSSLAWPLAYNWPVADLAPNFQPDQMPQEPTLILAQRRADQRVHFSRLAPLAHALLVSIQEHNCSGHQHLVLLAEAIGVELETILSSGQALLESLRERGVVLGVCIRG